MVLQAPARRIAQFLDVRAQIVPLRFLADRHVSWSDYLLYWAYDN